MRRFLALLLVVTPTLLVSPASADGPPIPVGCGDVLDVAGAHYKLWQDMVCNVNPAIRIVADDVTLNLGGFTLLCRETVQGIFVRASGVSIKNGTVSACRTGIVLDGAHDSTVMGMMVTDSLPFGMVLVGASGNDVKNNVVQGGLVGILLVLDSGDNRIANNEVTSTDGIVLTLNSHGNRVTGNHANGGRVGFVVNDSSDNTLTGNVANDNTFIGIALSDEGGDTLNNQVRGNVTNRNFVGVGLDDRVSGTVVRGNVASDNDFGIFVLGDAGSGVIPEGNLVQGNAAFGNSQADLAEFFMDLGVVEPCRNTWKSNDFHTQIGPAMCIE